jgi:hypothetical protein
VLILFFRQKALAYHLELTHTCLLLYTLLHLVYRKFFKSLLEIKPTEDTIGIMLHYDQSKTGEPRMVFSFGFVTAAELGPDDEAVSLELLEDGVTPKAPVDAMNDGLLKLYVSGNAFLKVLGAKLDVDTEKVIPILYDREGNLMDPNA